jgi:hypothetical protein
MSRYFLTPPTYYLELNMTDATQTEPAGAARFTAVSYPNVPPKDASVASAQSADAALAQDTVTHPAPLFVAPEETLNLLEARLTELESVVHTLTEFSRAAGHSKFVAWAERVAARVKSVL